MHANIETPNDTGTINTAVLEKLSAHYRSFGLKYRLKGMPYERCAELSWIVDHLSPRFSEPLRYLDIGTGESALPTYLYANTQWDITCIDKCPWVRNQDRFRQALSGANPTDDRFHVHVDDLLDTQLPAASFDLITCISVIEHFEGIGDTAAIQAAANLLRPGGTMILTTLVNEGYFAEFYLDKTVYGDEFHGAPVYYQRHYDLNSLQRRLIQPSGLAEQQRVYFGDYGFQCFEKVLQKPKLVKALYAWNTPRLASQFLSYRPYPVTRKDMQMNTASGLILVLEKPALQ